MNKIINTIANIIAIVLLMTIIMIAATFIVAGISFQELNFPFMLGFLTVVMGFVVYRFYRMFS
ncbi:hypothetical protein D3C87_2090340 [compost metagenome]